MAINVKNVMNEINYHINDVLAINADEEEANQFTFFTFLAISMFISILKADDTSNHIRHKAHISEDLH
jgi:hypothetical protein